MKRTCRKCNIEKETDNGDFSIQKNRKGLLIFNSQCKSCIKNYKKNHYIKNKKILSEKSKINYLKNKDVIKEKTKQYYISNKKNIIVKQTQYIKNNPHIRKICNDNYHQTHKQQEKEYREKNKIVRAKKAIQRHRQRMQTDIAFKLRYNVSRNIRLVLNGNKKGKSILQYLSYSIKDLKRHLEQQFEPWMTWQNWGRYDSKNWNDQDQSTWNWNIDHIVPQSDLPYNSMTDDNFKKCWCLDNLRPYSAKQNILDGSTRIRHMNGGDTW